MEAICEIYRALKQSSRKCNVEPFIAAIASLRKRTEITGIRFSLCYAWEKILGIESNEGTSVGHIASKEELSNKADV